MGLLDRAVKMIRAYHGSPHDFDRFELSPRTIGTGEGAQAYGHGLYFAENKATAEGYRDALQFPRSSNPSSIVEQVADDLNYYRGNVDAARTSYESMVNGKDAAGQAMGREKLAALPEAVQKYKGRLYEVDINADPEHFLDWDKPLSEQSAKVQAAYNDSVRPKLRTREIGNNPNFGTLTDVYIEGDGSLGIFAKDQLADVMENPAKYSPMRGDTLARDKAFTDRLREAGIPGIKFLDQGSRGAGDGTRNYVVFDDSMINILRKYGIPVAATGATGGLLSRVNPQSTSTTA